MLNLWETEKKRLTEIFLHEIVGNSRAISFAVLLEKQVPELFLVYLKRKLKQNLIREKIIQYQPSQRIPLLEEIVHRKIEKLLDELTADIVLGRDELSRLAGKLISFQIDILARPRQKMTEILFHESETRTTKDIIKILTEFDEKRHFIQSLTRTLSARKRDEISKKVFRLQSRKIERQVYKENPISALMNEIDAFCEFKKGLGDKNHDVITSTILLGFLKARNLHHVSEEFKDEADEKEFWTHDEIESALQRHAVVGPPELDETLSVEETSITEKDPMAVRFVPPESEIDLGIEPGNRLTTDRTIKIRFEEMFESAREEPETSEQGESLKESPSLQPQENVCQVQRENRYQKDRKHSELAWEKIIKPDQRKILLNKIFSKSDQDFSRFFDRVEKARFWNEAKAIIDGELEKRNININANEALLLGDIVFARFKIKNETQ